MLALVVFLNVWAVAYRVETYRYRVDIARGAQNRVRAASRRVDRGTYQK